jgi:2-polyprenyl-3-methyl-5-hydroxy-6-metoxy-1,4-benzoquinol methylase
VTTTLAAVDACPLCGGTSSRVVLEGTDHREGLGGWFAVVACAGCGLARTRPVPEDLSDWYSEGYVKHVDQTLTGRVVEAALRATASRTLRPPLRSLVTALVPDAALGGGVSPGARVLDVGAGNGAAVRALREAGIEAFGIEPGRGVEVARRLCGDAVRRGTLEENPFPGQRYALVRFNQVLEHVPDPVDALRRAGELLEPGGRIVIAVPNFASLGRSVFGSSWNGLELPRHLFHFTPRSLRATIAAAGLRTREIRSVALFGLLPSSLDARLAGGRRQRGWGMWLGLRVALYPVELAVAGGGRGDGLLAVADAGA